MKSNHIPPSEAVHLIRGLRTEDILVGQHNALFFNMMFSGCYVCRQSFSIRRRYMPSALLLLTLEGEGMLRYRGKEHRLTPSTVMLINTWDFHEYRALADGWTFKYLHFRGAMTDDYLSCIDAQFGPVFPIHGELFPETEAHLDAILRETEKPGRADYAIVSAEIYAILTSFLSGKNRASAAPKSAAAVRQAAAYISENYSRSITTREIANAAHLSRTYLSQLFRETYSMAPHEYLTMYRLSRAKDALRGTDASVTEIAEQCGFRDVFSLSRVFRRECGMSPTEYRKWAQV